MAYSNFSSYLKPGNKGSASGSLSEPDQDGFHKVKGKPKKSKKVRQNEKNTDEEDVWHLVRDDDDDVKVPIERKLQKNKSESLISSILLADSNQADQDSDDFYMVDDLVDTKNESLLKRMDDCQKQAYTSIKTKGNSDSENESTDSNDWENLDDSFEVIDEDPKVDDEQLLPMIANLDILNTNNTELPLHLQPFYEPDKAKQLLEFHTKHFDSDSSSSIEVIDSPQD